MFNFTSAYTRKKYYQIISAFIFILTGILGCDFGPVESSIDTNNTKQGPYSVFVETFDGGVTWSEVDTLRFAKELRAGAFGFASNIFVVGGQDTLGKGAIWQSLDNGLHWTNVLTTEATIFSDIAVTSNFKMIAVNNEGRIFLSTNDGTTWNIITTAPNTLNSVSFTPTYGVAVGNAGTILVSYNEGFNWTIKTSPTTESLFAVHCFGDTSVGVGSNGVYVMSTDAGVTWTEFNFNSTKIFITVDFSEEQNGRYGIAAGYDNTIFKTTTGAMNWKSLSSKMPGFGNIEDLHAAADGKCIAAYYDTGAKTVGSQFIYSTDRGETWSDPDVIEDAYIYKMVFRTFPAGYGFAVGNQIQN
ncbi:MAG: hypothetical protein IPJ03_03365 [Ignavibacteriales bacterium]|nr:hypothetical protein [Ignavibacteriales bacterium]